MKDNHVSEWKKIKEKYEFMLDAGFTTDTPKPALKFRIECIDSLIKIEESKEKELAHFR